MRMVPSQPNGKQTFTEHRVFEAFEGLSWLPGSACISSLNLSEHEYKRWGEADFVVVDQHGILVVEVKGGSVSCNEGVWRYESLRFGPVERTESPFAQAGGAYFSLGKFVETKFGNDLVQGLGGFCVIFASMARHQMERIVGGPELPAALCGYAEELASSERLADFIRRVQRYWMDKNRSSVSLAWTSTDCGKVVQALRPNFDRVPPLSLRVAEIRQERLQLTEEQYYVLDRMGTSARLLVTASAGCGKTFLAVEAARRECARGRNVLFVTGTDHLAKFLREAKVASGAEVVSFSELSKRNTQALADVLIVDEGQQITSRRHLDVLEKLVKGGLEGGCWRWFADPNRQVAGDSDFDEQAMELLRMLANHELPLLYNCRNTEQIVSWAEQLSGVHIGRPLVRGRGPQVSLIKVRDRKQLVGELSDALTRLQRSDVRLADIVLLWGGRDGADAAADGCSRAAFVAAPWPDCFERRDKVPVEWVASSAISDFRGLEAEHTLICGIEDSVSPAELRRALYLAATRATYSVTVFASPKVHGEILALLEAGFKQELMGQE